MNHVRIRDQLDNALHRERDHVLYIIRAPEPRRPPCYLEKTAEHDGRDHPPYARTGSLDKVDKGSEGVEDDEEDADRGGWRVPIWRG